MEKLSLETFEPDRAVPPYLNSPRSLEACHRHGINPIELVAVPISEFQKEFPNDNDAAQRRFDRIDGARRRVLQEVTDEWKLLCKSNWQPNTHKFDPSKESILKVPADAHSTLLEIQAEKFRRIEEAQFNALQRSLRIQLQKADAEVKHKRIIEKHQELQRSMETAKKEKNLNQQALLQQQLDKQARLEAEQLAELKQLRELDAQYAREKSEQEKERRLMDKRHRERREEERVQRELYTKQLKDSILNATDEKIAARKRIQEIRDRNIEQKQEEMRQQREQELQRRRKEAEDKLTRAKLEAMRRDEEERNEIDRRVKENDEYRRRVLESRNSNKRQETSNSQELVRQKLQKIRDETERTTEEKVERTTRELERKELLSRQELDKVRAAQEKRRLLKAIREESYQIAAMRRKKADDYKKLKLEKELKDKEDRCNAIKKGFEVLNQMRMGVRDVMVKTQLELKTEIDRLHHRDQFAPDAVSRKAMTVSNDVLFPNLQKVFGISDEWADANNAQHAQAMHKLSSLTAGAYENDQQQQQQQSEPVSFLPAIESSSQALSTEEQPRRDDKSDTVSLSYLTQPQSRIGYATMNIHTITPSHLADSLQKSKRQIEMMNAEIERAERNREAFRTSRSSSPVRRTAPASTRADEPTDFVQYRPSPTTQKSSTSTSPVKSTGKSQVARKLHSDLAHSTGSYDEPHRQHHVDVDLPVFELQPLESHESSRSAPNLFTDGQRSPQSRVTSSRKARRDELRTDKNDKAKYLAAPKGKFRREFSLDHPLAPGGTGKYSKERAQGKLPTGLGHEIERMDMKDEDNINLKAKTIAFDSKHVEDLTQSADKIERLTYTAQSKVVDPQNALQELKSQQNMALKQVLEEERLHEEKRRETSALVRDPLERRNLESVFAAERKIASERILTITKQHEETMKQAILNSMNLGLN